MVVGPECADALADRASQGSEAVQLWQDLVLAFGFPVVGLLLFALTVVEQRLPGGPARPAPREQPPRAARRAAAPRRAARSRGGPLTVGAGRDAAQARH